MSDYEDTKDGIEAEMREAMGLSDDERVEVKVRAATIAVNIYLKTSSIDVKGREGPFHLSKVVSLDDSTRVDFLAKRSELDR